MEINAIKERHRRATEQIERRERYRMDINAIKERHRRATEQIERRERYRMDINAIKERHRRATEQIERRERMDINAIRELHRRATEQIEARRRERYRMDINAKRKFEVKQAIRNDDTDRNSDTSDEIEVLCEKTPEVCEAEKIEKAKRDGNFINLVHSEPAVERSKRQKVDATTIRNFIDLVHSEPAVERSKRQKVDDNQSARGTGCEGSMTRARRHLISRR
jgi:hypothetical protein